MKMKERKTGNWRKTVFNLEENMKNSSNTDKKRDTV